MDFLGHSTVLSISDEEFRHSVHFVGKFFGVIGIVFQSNVIDFQTKWTIHVDEASRCDAETWYARSDHFTLFILDASLCRKEKSRKWNLQAKMSRSSIFFLSSSSPVKSVPHSPWPLASAGRPSCTAHGDTYHSTLYRESLRTKHWSYTVGHRLWSVTPAYCMRSNRNRYHVETISEHGIWLHCQLKNKNDNWIDAFDRRLTVARKLVMLQ